MEKAYRPSSRLGFALWPKIIDILMKGFV